MPTLIAEFEKSFADNAIAAHSRLRQWKNEDHGGFLKEAVEILKRGVDNTFTQLILQLCREDGSTLQQILFTADLMSLDEAARLVRLASKTDPGFQVHLVGAVKAEIDKAGSSVRSEDLTRLMEMLVHAVDANRLVPFLAKLCEHGDERIRSKAVLLTGRVARQLPKGVALLRDGDARVRANAVEALWGRTDTESIQFFKEAAKDPNHRVAANALLGLHKAGDLASVQGISKLLDEADPGRFLAGIWLTGQTRDQRFTQFIQASLQVSTGRQKLGLLRAGRMIKQRRDDLAAKPPIKLEAVRSERGEKRGEEGRVRLAFLAFAGSGELCGPEEIRATDAVIYDGDIRVDHFRWAAWGGKDPLHASFLIPLRTGVSENFATQLVSAMELGISGKRRGDHWAIQKYELAGSTAVNSLSPVEFSSLSETLRSEQLRASRGAAPSLTEGVDRLISMFPASAPRRHLVIVLDPNLERDFELPSGWLERCRRFQVTPHVLVCGEMNPESLEKWREFTSSLNGYLLECAHTGDLPLTVRRLSLSLQASFEITYRLGRIMPNPNGVEPVTLEIFSDCGYGRLKLDPDGQVFAEAQPLAETEKSTLEA